MTSHGRHPDGAVRDGTREEPRLSHALCGRWVPSWLFVSPMEAACQSCRDRHTDATSKAAAALGRLGGKAGRGASQVRGDSDHYRAIRAKRPTPPQRHAGRS